jgi:hypothetical protein
MFKVGDKVYSKVYGLGVVTLYVDKGFSFEYPVGVDFQKSNTFQSFTLTGKWSSVLFTPEQDITLVELINTRYNKLKGRTDEC